MGLILKAKIIVFLVSSTILTLLTLIDNSFYAPVLINKWRQLTWDDFQGVAKPFSRWSAVINSNVYLEYDSISNNYTAYAGQNNQQSWVKSSSKSSSYVLNHEQYHFNITEYHSRLMNEYLQDSSISEDEVYLKLGEVRSSLASMQSAYDQESKHGQSIGYQRKWEFKIDSLLQSPNDSVFKFDPYSGAGIFFPKKPSYFEGNNLEDKISLAYRIFEVVDYDMVLSLTSFSYEWKNLKSVSDIVLDNHIRDSSKITKVVMDTLYTKDLSCYINQLDTVENTYTQTLWIFKNELTYKVQAKHPSNKSGLEGYEYVARAFLNSFHQVSTKEYWIEEFNKNSLSFKVARDKKSSVKEDESYNFCLSFSNPGWHGFSGSPIISDNGYIIPYKTMFENDSVVSKVLMDYSDNLYTFDIKPDNNFLFLPAEEKKERDSIILVGHYLDNDLKDCKNFYFQSIRLPALSSLVHN